jgi:hypothetical protein
MRRTFLGLILPIFLLTSCGKNSNEKKVDENSNAEITSPNAEMSSVEEREPNDEEVREFGRIIGIEDSGYPRYYISVEFPEREFTEDFNINLEEGIINLENLSKLNGKYVTLYYISEETPDLMDMVYACESVLGEYAPEYVQGWKEITGVLSGAEETTPGDLPGEVTIKAKNGEEMSFEYFVEDAMVAANGKEVTVYYDYRYQNRITYLMPSKND